MRVTTQLIPTAILLAPLVRAQSVYDRSLMFAYSLQGGEALPYSDEELLGYIDQVQPALTAITPFFINVADVSAHTSMIDAMQARNITLQPAVGLTPADGNLNSTTYFQIALGYRNFTDRICLENTQGFYDDYGAEGIQSMIDYCISIGFNHIMLNPWPFDGPHIVPFNATQVDASINQVVLDYNHDTFVLYTNATNWFPGHQNQIEGIRAFRPTASILINYEAAPQQNVLVNIEEAQKNASIAAMNITINEIKGQYRSEDLHWIPPLDNSYDAVKLGTWSWIAQQLSLM